MTITATLTTLNSNDRIAKMMDVPSIKFSELHKDKVDEMKRLLINYVKGLREAMFSMNRNTANGEPAAAAATAHSPDDLEVKITDDGFPLIPTAVQFDNLRKGELDSILRSYLECHYSVYPNPNCLH
jgi:hypothetical protein